MSIARAAHAYCYFDITATILVIYSPGLIFISYLDCLHLLAGEDIIPIQWFFFILNQLDYAGSECCGGLAIPEPLKFKLWFHILCFLEAIDEHRCIPAVVSGLLCPFGHRLEYCGRKLRFIVFWRHCFEWD